MKCAERIDNRPCFVYNEAGNSCWRVIQMYLKRKVDAFLEEWKYNLIRPFIEKVDGLSFCQSSLPLRTWLKICSTSQLKCYIAAGASLIDGYAHLCYSSQISSAQAMETGLALPEGGDFSSRWGAIGAGGNF